MSILFIHCIFLLTTFRLYLSINWLFYHYNVVLRCLLTFVLLGLNIALFYAHLVWQLWLNEYVMLCYAYCSLLIAAVHGFKAPQNQFTPPRQTRQNCLVCFASASAGFPTTQDCRRQKNWNVWTRSEQSSNSHRHTRHDADRTVLSCLLWRCELSRPYRPISVFSVRVCRAGAGTSDRYATETTNFNANSKPLT